MQDALSSILHNSFGEYIEGLHNLDTSRFPLTLSNLKLKPSRIQEEMDEDGKFPFDITAGRIGSISVNPGWGTVEVKASDIVLNFTFNPMKAMRAAMKGPDPEEQEVRHQPPPPPVPPRYCRLHSSSEQRPKVEPRFKECYSCRTKVQTNYADFTLCPPCSEKEHRCMLCGKDAPQAGNYVPAASANPCGHDYREAGVPPPPDGSRFDRDRRDDRFGRDDRRDDRVGDRYGDTSAKGAGYGRGMDDGLPPPPPPPPRGRGGGDLPPHPPSRGEGSAATERGRGFRSNEPAFDSVRSASSTAQQQSGPFGGGPLSPEGRQHGPMASFQRGAGGPGAGPGQGYSQTARGGMDYPRGPPQPGFANKPKEEGGMFDGIWNMLNAQWGQLQGSCMSGPREDERPFYGAGHGQGQLGYAGGASGGGGGGNWGNRAGPGPRGQPSEPAWRGGA